MHPSPRLKHVLIGGLTLALGTIIGHTAFPLTSAFNTTQNLTIAPYVTHDEAIRLIQEYDQTAVEPLRRQIAQLSQGTFGGTTGTFGTYGGITGTFGGTTGIYGGTTGAFGGTTGIYGGTTGTFGGGGPSCGNGICEAGEAKICPVCFRAPCDVQCQPGTCEYDCPAGGTTGLPPIGGSCQGLEQQINVLAQQPQSCVDDGDCTVFTRKREPFFTCGVALNRDISRDLKDAIDDFTDDCVEDRSVRDVDCPRFRDRCVQGRCVLEPR